MQKTDKTYKKTVTLYIFRFIVPNYLAKIIMGIYKGQGW